MKIKGFAMMVVCSLILLGCKKDNFIEGNELMIALSEGIGVDMHNTWTRSADLPYFDISSYSNIKSVVMAVSDIKTNDETGNDLIGEASFELYDITNDKPIENSIVISDDIENNSYKSSANIINDIPRQKIKLGIRISSDGDFSASCSHIYLILSR
ncbi:hypothetical protein [Sunxiuqinia indica]|uniref:hypothetical protein n=1 Tax=Sunxiuqinia indica TaxID=2692584 RepID=UPI00135C6973|nr:hypothetical protein [Sunxiuqinia indica]